MRTTSGRRGRRAARWLAVAVAAATGAAGLTTAGVAGAAAPWVPGAVYGEGGFPQAFDIAVTGDGGQTATWSGGSPTDPTSVVQRTAPGGDPPTAPARLVPAGETGGGFAIAPLTASDSVVLILQRDDATSEMALGLRTVDGRGRPGATTAVVSEISDAGGSPALAGNGNGHALVAWAEPGEGTYARVLRPDGTLAPRVRVGDGREFTRIRATLLPDGTGYVLAETDSGTAVARLDAQGALAGEPQVILGALAALGAGPDSAAVVWHEPASSGNQLRVRAAVLPATGPVVGTTRSIAEDDGTSFSGADAQATAVTVAAGGTMTVAWTAAQDASAPAPLQMRRVPPSGAIGPVVTLSDGLEGAQAEAFTRLVPSADGRLRAVWMRTTPGMQRGTVLSRTVGADGALGPQGTVTENVVFPKLVVATDDVGTVTVGWLGLGEDQTPRVETALLDESPPTVTIEAPRSAVLGQPVELRADAFDRSGLSAVRWDFGDRRTAEGATVTHVYDRPGYFEVAVTATDRSGNEAVAYQTIHVTEPVAPPGGPPIGPPAGPPPIPSPPGRSPAPATKADPALRLRTVQRTSRRARTVRVAGTISRKASGRMTIRWRQKVGRRTVTRTVRTRISRGRYAARVRLSASMARARTRATVTVRYAGDADTRAATAIKRVKPPRR